MRKFTPAQTKSIRAAVNSPHLFSARHNGHSETVLAYVNEQVNMKPRLSGKDLADLMRDGGKG